MKIKTLKASIALAIGLTLAVGAGGYAAFADEPPPEAAVDTPIVEVVEETPAITSEVEVAAVQSVVGPPKPPTDPTVNGWYSFITTPKLGVTTPKNASDVTWPQQYVGAGQLTPPCGVWYQVDRWKGKQSVIDAILSDGFLSLIGGTPEDSQVIQEWEFRYGGACPPPVANTVCETVEAGPVSTDLADLWGNVDTRAKGHSEYVPGGLHVWTEDSSSTSKVSEGIPVSIPLREVGQLGIDATAQPGNVYPYGPGLNLFVDINGDLVPDGTLVYETVYGQDLWVTGGSAQALKDASVHTGGNGSENHGTIDHFLLTFPDATVVGLAYSLGSGVQGDWVIDSITFGCTVYTFDKVAVPEIPEPLVEVVVTPGEFGGDEPTCENPEVVWTRTLSSVTTTTTHKVIVLDGAYQVVLDRITVGEPVVTIDEETRTVTYEGPDCEVPPTEEPEPPVKATPPTELGHTGTDTLGTTLAASAGALALLLGALGITIARRRRAG